MSVIGDGQTARAHVVEIELVLGQLDDVVADLLVLGECLGCQSVDILDGVLPARRGLRGFQGSHCGVRGELEIQVGACECGSEVSLSYSTSTIDLMQGGSVMCASDCPDIATTAAILGRPYQDPQTRRSEHNENEKKNQDVRNTQSSTTTTRFNPPRPCESSVGPALQPQQ